MTYIFDSILDSHTAREIAEDTNLTEEQAAKTWFSEVLCNEEGYFGDKPRYNTFIDKINDEWDLYYDYGADYYFAVNDNMEEE